MNQNLKTTLQTHGALRPEAWQDIQQNMQTISLGAGDSLPRTEGSFSFLAQGILKEYDPEQRSRPAIINFLAQGQCFTTRRHNQRHYLKAIQPSTINQWNRDALHQLHQSYPELKNSYDALCAGYDLTIARRAIFLELPPRQRLPAFREPNRPIIAYLKKKDIANYLNLSYSYLLHIWNDS